MNLINLILIILSLTIVLIVSGDNNTTINQIDYNITTYIDETDPKTWVNITITAIDLFSNNYTSNFNNDNSNNIITSNKNNSIFSNIYNYFRKSSSSSSITASSKISLEDYIPSNVDSNYPFYVTNSYMKLKAWDFLKGNTLCADKIADGQSQSYNWCVKIQSDGNMQVTQSGTNLGWCNNNNGCQEINEGYCGNGRANEGSDAQCSKWAVSQGDTCGSMRRYAYVYMICGYQGWGNVLYGVVESPTCVYTLKLTIDCSGTAGSGYNYIYSCPPYNLAADQSSTCTLKNEYNSNLAVTITSCDGNIAAYKGDTKLTAKISGTTYIYNNDYCSTGSGINSVIVPTGSTLELTEQCYSGSCSGRYQVGVKTGKSGIIYGAASTWIAVPGLDSASGNDIQAHSGLTQTECASYCRYTDGCNHAQYIASTSMCYTKLNFIGFAFCSSASRCNLLVPPEVILPYIPILNIDFYGNDIGSFSVSTADQCYANCRSNSDCVGANYNGAGGCWIKNKLEGVYTTSGSGAKFLAKPGSILPGINFSGNDLTAASVGGSILSYYYHYSYYY